MKVKTARATLRAKFDEFVETIEDEEVKELVKQNTIITGGCIASMLLKEPVNDYDLYFRNFKTAKAVADYYVDVFLKEQDKKKKKAEGDGEFDDIVKAKGLKADKSGKLIQMSDAEKSQSGKNKDESVNVPITVETYDNRVQIVVKSAGVVGDKQGDYHYFEMDPDGNDAEEYLKAAFEGNEFQKRKPGSYAPILLTGNAITLSDDVQLVLRFYGDPAQIHQFYDFVHCTNYWTSWDDEIVTNKEALESLLARELRYIGSQYPICSIIRIRKFLKRGWSINAGQVFKMCVQLAAMVTPQDESRSLLSSSEFDDFDDTRDMGGGGSGIIPPDIESPATPDLDQTKPPVSPAERAITEARDAQSEPQLSIPEWTKPGAKNLLLDNLDLLREQLVGVDQAYFMELIDKLKNPSEDGKKLDQTYLFSLIDEIF